MYNNSIDFHYNINIPQLSEITILYLEGADSETDSNNFVVVTKFYICFKNTGKDEIS